MFELGANSANATGDWEDENLALDRDTGTFAHITHSSTFGSSSGVLTLDFEDTDPVAIEDATLFIERETAGPGGSGASLLIEYTVGDGWVEVEDLTDTHAKEVVDVDLTSVINGDIQKLNALQVRFDGGASGSLTNTGFVRVHQSWVAVTIDHTIIAAEPGDSGNDGLAAETIIPNHLDATVADADVEAMPGEISNDIVLSAQVAAAPHEGLDADARSSSLILAELGEASQSAQEASIDVRIRRVLEASGGEVVPDGLSAELRVGTFQQDDPAEAHAEAISGEVDIGIQRVQNVHLIEVTNNSIIIGWEPGEYWRDVAHSFDVRRNGQIIASRLFAYQYEDAGADLMINNEYEVRGRLWFVSEQG